MNDIILTALMQLSALVAQINKTHFHKNAHILVKSYLEKSFGSKDTRNHLKQYFEYFKQYETEIESLVTRNNNESNTQIIHKLCESLNKELTLNDRYILMLSFLELIYIDKVITHEEQEFIGILANNFKIGHGDFLNACDFIFNAEPIRVHTKNYLVICDTDVFISDELEGSWITRNKPIRETYHTIHQKGLKGKIYVLKFIETDLLALKYSGDTPVNLTNQKIEDGKYYTLSPFEQLYINNKPLSIHEINYTFQNESTIQLVFRGNNITLQTPQRNGKSGKEFSFCEESGNIVAVLGNNSDTSKLINILSGRIDKQKPDICLNGYNIYNDYYKIQKLIGFVPNHAIYNEHISVYQNLYYNCKLAFPQFAEPKIISLVNEVLETTKLDEIQNAIPAKYGSFDAFFRFLTNLAIELVRDPWLLFVDASLENLSIPECEIVFKILRSFTAKGKLAFVTCYQPNTLFFEHCNKLWIVDQNNYLIYNGDTHQVIDYFSSNSDNVIQAEEHCSFCGSVRPERLNQIINQKTINEKGELTTHRKIKPEEWYALYKEKIEKNMKPKECKKVLPLHLGSIPTIPQQYFVYLKTKINGHKTNLLLRIKDLLGFALLSIIAGLLFRSDWSHNYLAGSNPNLHIFIIFSIIIMFILGIIIAENENHKEKKHIHNEIKRNLSFFSYLNAQLSCLFIISAVYSAVYTLLCTAILGILIYSVKYWLIFFTLSALGNIVGILLSNLFAKRKIVYFALLIIIVFNILFNGLTINTKSFPEPLSSAKYTPAVTELSPVKWAFEALFVEQTIHNDYESIFYELDQNIENAVFNANYLIPAIQQKLFQMNDNFRKQENTKALKSIQFEIKQFATNSDIFPFEYIDDLIPEKVNNTIIKETSDYLTYIQLVLAESIQHLTQRKHELENKLIDSLGNTNYPLFKKKYFNTYLFDLANKFNSSVYVKFSNGEIIKSMNPLYLIPTSNFGRAQLFAPVKMFNYLYYNTFWFNLIILWWFIFIFFIVLLISYPFLAPFKSPAY
jgi:ABC transport system ATP-binding/permease protein